MRGRWSMRRLAAAATVGGMLAFGAGTAAYAQTSTGSIRGTVKDAQGQPVANAAVIATQPQTNLQRHVMTTQTGFYNMSGLTPGAYVVRVNMLGYAEREQPVRLQMARC